MNPFIRRFQTVFQTTLLAVGLLGVLMTTSHAQDPIPQFKDYPATEVYRGSNAPLMLTAKDREFRTRLGAAAKAKPNFAGHYILTYWGCGTSCAMGALIDANTGRVYWFPFSVCCWGMDVDEHFNPIEFRLDSRLIVFSGERNEKEGDNGAHFYQFENGRFKLIHSALKGEKTTFNPAVDSVINVVAGHRHNIPTAAQAGVLGQ